MRSTKRSLRIAISWLMAIGCATGSALFFFTLIITQLSSGTHATSLAGDPWQTIKEVESMVLALSMAPLETREAPLVAAMIENHEDARRHQKGLQEAIVVLEMIVEGDISRFMAIYRSDKLPNAIGPIRSLRPHFISAIRGYKPLLLHIGGSAIAYEALERFPDIPNHDGIRYDGETYERDTGIDPPHNLFMRKAFLRSVLEQKKQQLQTVHLPLYPASHEVPEGGEHARTVKLDFDSEEHNAVFSYKPLYDLYVRSTFNAHNQAQPKTIAVLITEVQGFNQKGHIPWTKTFGVGRMFLFRDGKKFGGTWSREKGEPFRFLDHEGNVIPVDNGQVWITMLPMETMVSWE